MSAPDFAAILSSSAAMTWTASNMMTRDEACALVARQLLHPVFALCTACGGTGSVGEPGYVYHGIPEPGSYEPCPDCPTIGQLLAIGAAVMSATLMPVHGQWAGVVVQALPEGSPRAAVFAEQLLDYLRAVQP